MEKYYWSRFTNPETGEKLELFAEYMRRWSNCDADIYKLINSEYGEKLGELMDLSYRWDDPMDQGCLDWYAGIGVRKEMFETERFFSRWTLLTPLDMCSEANKCKKYPLIFDNHGGGNYIESEEFASGFNTMVGREHFAVAYLQDTNTDNVLRVLEFICKHYPIDRERVYVTGHSQGGGKAHDCAVRATECFAAFAPCGNDIYRDRDRYSVMYTDEELQRLKDAELPFMQIVGCNERANIIPLNNWLMPRKRDFTYTSEYHENPPVNGEQDPTKPSDPNHIGGTVLAPDGADTHNWMVEQLNRRLSLLDCEPVDPERCIAYEATPEDELHHVLGFYGDREKIIKYYGLKHYIIDIDDRKGKNVFRYVAVENSPHWPPIMTGELTWDFFKNFRRSSLTGKTVVDPYKW